MDMPLKSWFSYKGMPFWVEIHDNFEIFKELSQKLDH